ncbi:MAG: hypothetical protein OXC03_02020 [Flavobacteriaceae bacterium]|nr:hypothetical protein [Flavobacteriaceae bacterium]
MIFTPIKLNFNWVGYIPKSYLFLGLVFFGHEYKGISQVHQVGVFLGVSSFQISENAEEDLLKGLGSSFVVSAVYRLNLNSYFSIQGALSTFETRNPLSNSYPLFSLIKNSALSSRNLEMSGRLEYWLIPRDFMNWEIPQFRPYIFAGGGVLRQRIYAHPHLCFQHRSDSEVTIEEAISISQDVEKIGSGGNKKFNLSGILLGGVGVSINASRLFNFGAEFGARYTGVDDLDCYENVNGNDWYFFYGLSATISLRDFPLVNY